MTFFGDIGLVFLNPWRSYPTQAVKVTLTPKENVDYEKTVISFTATDFAEGRFYRLNPNSVTKSTASFSVEPGSDWEEGYI